MQDTLRHRLIVSTRPAEFAFLTFGPSELNPPLLPDRPHLDRPLPQLNECADLDRAAPRICRAHLRHVGGQRPTRFHKNNGGGRQIFH